MDVHPTAVIAAGAELADDVVVGPHCFVGPRVRLAAGCVLHSHVVIDGDTHVGDDCQFWPHSVIGTSAQHRDSDFEGRLRIGAHNRFRESVTVNVGSRAGRGITELGESNLLLAGAHVAHDASLGNHVTMTNSAMAAGHTSIADHAVIGAMVGLHQFARVGRLAMLGAGAMVPRDAPPYALVQGDRARIRGVNLVGMRRAGLDQDEVATIKRTYRLLFWRPEAFAARVARVRRELGGHPRVDEILAFLDGSRRGVLMARGRSDPGEPELQESGD